MNSQPPNRPTLHPSSQQNQSNQNLLQQLQQRLSNPQNRFVEAYASILTNHVEGIQFSTRESEGRILFVAQNTKTAVEVLIPEHFNAEATSELALTALDALNHD